MVGKISVRYAHGDIITYLVIEINFDLDGICYSVEADVVEKLPVSIWDGTHLTFTQCWLVETQQRSSRGLYTH